MTSQTGNHGFTLIEAMITVMIIAIVAGLAAPAFDSIIVSNRVSSQTNNFLSALAYARSEAVKRSQTVELVANGGDWDTGYTVELESDGTVLRDYAALGGDAEFAATGGATTFEFNARGMLDSATDTLELCHGPDYEGRIISITGTGMSNVAKKNDCT